MADLTFYLPIVGIVGMLMLFIVLLTYLASHALKVPEWEAYLHIELYEIVMSFIILIAAIGFYEGMNVAAAQLTGVPSVTQAASGFLTRMVEDGVVPGMRDTFFLQTCLSVWNMFSRRTGEFVLTTTYKLFPGIDSLMQILNLIGFGMTTVYGSLTVQLMGMQLIDATMVTLFLPAGIILRFFPPTREAGAFLIAFAMGFGIVFPTTYVIHEKVMDEMNMEVYYPPRFAILSVCGAKFPIAGLFGTYAIQNLPRLGIGTPIIGTPIIPAAYNAVFSEVGLNFLTPLEFSFILEGLASLSMPAFFLPALSTTITIAFIGAATKFILMKL